MLCSQTQPSCRSAACVYECMDICIICVYVCALCVRMHVGICVCILYIYIYIYMNFERNDSQTLPSFLSVVRMCMHVWNICISVFFAVCGKLH